MLKQAVTHPYVRARLSCCVPSILPSIPDGSSGRHFTVCLFAVDRLTFTTGTPTATVGLQFSPWIPTPGRITSGQARCILNGEVSGSPTLFTGFGIAQQFRGLPKLFTRPGSQSNGVDVYSATSMRIVSQTHSIQYTGPVTTCSGSIRSWQSDDSLEEGPDVSATSATATFPTTGVAVQSLLATNASWQTWAPIGTQTLLWDGSVSDAPISSSIMVRPEQGLTVRLGHKSGVYKSIPVRNAAPAIIPLAGATSTASVVTSHLLAESSVAAPCVIAYDNEWTSQHVVLDSINQDAAYSITSCVCVEFIPIASSPFYPLAKNGSEAQPGLIKAVDTVITNQGTALPMVDPM